MRKLCFSCYKFLLYCMIPVALLRLIIKAKGDTTALAKLSERFGGYNDINVAGRVIWLHAVSVGETVAASAMVQQLLQELPEYKILFSVTTASGRVKANTIFSSNKAVTVVYFPYDITFAITKLLAKFNVALFVGMETEIWPNLYKILSHRNIPIVLANARLSAKSCRKYAKFHNFFSESFAAISHIAAQDTADAKRFMFMGAAAANVQVLGSMKYDITPPAKSNADFSSGMLSYFSAAPTLMGISTHGNEEEIILAAFAEIKRAVKNAKLILVPRHPARTSELVKLITTSGLKHVLYSASAGCDGTEDILLVDKIGVLADLFQVFDIAYVGGSLVARGGQNPIEPAFYAKPVLMGPSRYNFHHVAKGMARTGGLLLVRDAGDIAHETIRLLGDMKLSANLGQKLQQHVKQQAGATMRHVALIKKLL